MIGNADWYDEQEVIFEIESPILLVYILDELLQTVIKIENAKVAVIVGNSMSLCGELKRLYVVIGNLKR